MTSRSMPKYRVKGDDPISILVDRREPKSLMGDLGSVGFSPVKTELETGDFYWVTQFRETVGVERKTASDFLASMSDKQANKSTRLRNQMERMVAEYDWPFLLIEGALSAETSGWTQAGGRHREWPWAVVDQTLLIVQVRGIMTIRCAKGRVAERLAVLANWLEQHNVADVQLGRVWKSTT